MLYSSEWNMVNDYKLEGTYMEASMVYFKIVLIHHECYSVIQYHLESSFYVMHSIPL
jgi:hypothetical protein